MPCSPHPETGGQGAPVTIAVLSNDSDADGDSLTVTAVITPANGTAIRNATNTVTRRDVGFVGTG